MALAADLPRVALTLLTVALLVWIAYLAIEVVAVLARPPQTDPIEAALRHHHDQEEEEEEDPPAYFV